VRETTRSLAAQLNHQGNHETPALSVTSSAAC